MGCRRIALLAALAAVTGGCGGESGDSGYGQWIKPPPGLPPHPFPVARAEEAARVVRHQLEDHCGRRFVAARCREQTRTWECEYRSPDGDGRTAVEKDPGAGEEVECG